MSNAVTKIQEVLFDICDLINSGEIDDIALTTFQEFETLKEFLEEQKEKLGSIESEITEAI
jgi:hypothetical protein